jgi:hypothetical protein
MSLFGAGWASGSNPAIRRLIDPVKHVDSTGQALV